MCLLDVLTFSIKYAIIYINYFDCLPQGVRSYVAFKKEGTDSFIRIFADSETGLLNIKDPGTLEVGFTYHTEDKKISETYASLYNYRHAKNKPGLEQFDSKDAYNTSGEVDGRSLTVEVKISKEGNFLKHERYPANGIRTICFLKNKPAFDIFGIGVTNDNGKLYIVCQKTYSNVRVYRQNGNVMAEEFNGRRWEDMQTILAYAYDQDMVDVKVPGSLPERGPRYIKLAEKMVRVLYFNTIQGYGVGMVRKDGREESILILRNALPQNQTGTPRSCREGDLFFCSVAEKPGPQSRTHCEWVAKKLFYPRKEEKQVIKKTIHKKPEAKPVAKKAGEKKKEQKPAPNGKTIFGGLKSLFIKNN